MNRMNQANRMNRMDRSWARLIALVCACATLAACASMPRGGGVDDVPGSETGSDGSEQQVRVFAMPPRAGDTPSGLVTGFLEAVTSDEADYGTARMYLTPEAAQRWRPDTGITVLDAFPRTQQVPAGVDDADALVEVSGTRIATVDAQAAYRPDQATDTPARSSFRLRRGTDGQWRIADLPDGLMLSQADFHRIYRSVSTYWYAANAPEPPMLVPDPLYLRARVGLTTMLVRHLLDGPTAWLSPVVRSAFPAGTRLVDRTVTIDGDGTARVRLSDEARQADAERCDLMAAQVLFTLSHASNVDNVELATRRGQLLCSTSKSEATRHDRALSRATPTAYFLSPDNRATMLRPDESTGREVPGPFGDGTHHLSALAVSRDQQQIAGVTANQRQILVGSLEGGPVRPWATAPGSALFTSPSWDGRGALWVLEKDSQASRAGIVLLAATQEAVQRVDVRVVGVDPARVTGLRLSPDGTRIALVIDDATVRVARVERALDRGAPVVTVTDPLPVLPDLEMVRAVSWDGSARLAVLGQQREGTLQPQIVDVDGGSSVSVAPVTGMLRLAAADAADQPLLADSSDRRLYRQAQGNTWKVVQEGSYPVYPG